MRRKVLEAVLDLILPPESGMGLPSGTAAGLDIGRHGAAAEITAADRSGRGWRRGGLPRGAGRGAARSGRGCGARRLKLSAQFLSLLLPDYYKSAAVLRAYGWRAEPPQPRGHGVAAMDEATGKALERVRRRPKIWRSPAS